MSKYSGKCDMADTIAIHGERILNAKIYTKNSNAPLQINDVKDLIPYYPYTIGSAYFDNTEGTSVIYLSAESWVDYEERDRLTFYLQHLLRIYNRCKRQKVEFDIDTAVNAVCWHGWNQEPITELANRVKVNGKKATIDGLHLQMHERYRRELVAEMVKNGLNPANYGYARFV